MLDLNVRMILHIFLVSSSVSLSIVVEQMTLKFNGLKQEFIFNDPVSQDEWHGLAVLFCFM